MFAGQTNELHSSSGIRWELFWTKSVSYFRKHPDHKYDPMQYMIISLKSMFLKNDLTLEVTVGRFWLLCWVLVVRKVLQSFFAEMLEEAVWCLCGGFVFVIFPTFPATRVRTYIPPETKSY